MPEAVASCPSDHGYRAQPVEKDRAVGGLGDSYSACTYWHCYTRVGLEAERMVGIGLGARQCHKVKAGTACACAECT